MSVGNAIASLGPWWATVVALAKPEVPGVVTLICLAVAAALTVYLARGK